MYLIEYLITRDGDSVIYLLLHNNLLFRFITFMHFNQVKHFFISLLLM